MFKSKIKTKILGKQPSLILIKDQFSDKLFAVIIKYSESKADQFGGHSVPEHRTSYNSPSYMWRVCLGPRVTVS